jgi:hypothetical protein
MTTSATSHVTLGETDYMTDSSIGEVEITLDGKSVTLRCGLAVAKRVNAYAGGSGFQGITARLGMVDFDTYVALIAFALDKKPIDVEGAVYRTGILTLTADLTTFVTYLANGGKPVAAVETAA